ncbi:MAG: type II secretion system protein GspE, partial [Actinobacteria bacterium]|nr:type II secretion system protein GspE [Actinomycetota bacterium]
MGSLLVETGLITEDQLAEALATQVSTGRPIGRVLIDQGLISESDLVRSLAKQVGLEFVDLTERVIDATVASLIPEGLARRYQALPISWDEDVLVVAMADPSNVLAVDDIRALTGAQVRCVVATSAQIRETIDRFHRLDSEVDDLASQAADELSDNDELANVSAVVEDAPIVKFVNLLITQAVADRASDIHVEPAERDLRIRFRIDGVLHEVMRSPKAIQAGVISRLKVMSDINIAERRIPQDGRMSLTVGGKPIDLRVATLPTVHGEKVVMRILDKNQALLSLQDQGFLPDTLERYERS